jgi:hypothetical protein
MLNISVTSFLPSEGMREEEEEKEMVTEMGWGVEEQCNTCFIAHWSSLIAFCVELGLGCCFPFLKQR